MIWSYFKRLTPLYSIGLPYKMNIFSLIREQANGQESSDESSEKCDYLKPLLAYTQLFGQGLYLCSLSDICVIIITVVLYYLNFLKKIIEPARCLPCLWPNWIWFSASRWFCKHHWEWILSTERGDVRGPDRMTNWTQVGNIQVKHPTSIFSPVLSKNFF